MTFLTLYQFQIQLDNGYKGEGAQVYCSPCANLSPAATMRII